jgi:hypothetical protein
MLNANASNSPSVAKQLQGLSFDEIVAIVENHKQLLSKSEQIIAQRDCLTSTILAARRQLF